MTDKRPPMMPPVPRDHDEASFSEMVPFRSSKIRLAKSPLMLFGIITAITVPFLFALLGAQLTTMQEAFENFQMIVKISVFFILMLIMLALFTYSRSDRPVWVFGLAFVAIAAITWTPALFGPLVWPFREIIPGLTPMALDQTSFIRAFIGMLFVAGLAEEFVKAIPILIGAALTWRVMAGKMADTGFVSKFRVRGPLDGVLMGLFAGAGFIMAETAGQYVEGQFINAVNQGGSYEAGVAAGLLLLLPRTFSGIIMHMGWSAIVGYAIGLATIRPKARWKLIGIGYIIGSVTHALWNSHWTLSPHLGYLVSIATAVMAIGCLLKARQIELASSGPAPETFGSIVVERPRAAPPAMPTPAPAYIPPVIPPAQAPAMSRPAADEALALDVEGLTIPLRGGGTVDLGSEPALGGRGSGIVGAVVPHPSRANVLGLRNAGGGSWTARLRDGSQQVIDRDQNIRLAAGVQIDFGGGLTGRVVKVA
jgi:RsiW-degrading membrane proteinase PrsW (M82 family)